MSLIKKFRKFKNQVVFLIMFQQDFRKEFLITLALMLK